LIVPTWVRITAAQGLINFFYISGKRHRGCVTIVWGRQHEVIDCVQSQNFILFIYKYMTNKICKVLVVNIKGY